MERYGKEITVKEVMKKARCSNCGQKNSFEFRIIYIGGSYDAMLGAELPSPKNLIRNRSRFYTIIMSLLSTAAIINMTAHLNQIVKSHYKFHQQLRTYQCDYHLSCVLSILPCR